MSAAATLDAWLWPPNLAAECATQTGRAGGLSVRYLKSDHHLARLLISSLATSSKGLADIPARDLASMLGAAGERVAAGLDERIVMAIATNAGLTAPMAGVVARGMAESWTTESLMLLLHAEFPDPAVLDGFVVDGPTADAPTADSPTAVTAREVTAAAPGVTVHIGAGSVPGVTVTSMIRALMVKSPVLAKPGAGDIVLTRLFARELHRADDRLRHAVAMQYWPGGDPGHDGWEREVLTRAGQVVVYGGDDTIESVRARTPATTRLIEHPNRLGVAIVDPRSAPDADGHAARAVALFDQKGCVSTHLILLLGALDDPLAPENQEHTPSNGADASRPAWRRCRAPFPRRPLPLVSCPHAISCAAAWPSGTRAPRTSGHGPVRPEPGRWFWAAPIRSSRWAAALRGSCPCPTCPGAWRS